MRAGPLDYETERLQRCACRRNRPHYRLVRKAQAMISQNTSDLWTTLCADLQGQRARSAEHHLHQEAAEAFVEAARSAFSRNSKRLVDAIEIAGDVHQSANGLGRAKESFAEALKLATDAQLFAVAARLEMKIGLLDEAVGKSEEAIRHYKNALDCCKTAHDRSAIPTILNNLGGIERRLRRPERAETYYLEAVEEARQIHGNDHPEVAVMLNNLGVAFTEAGAFDKAEDVHLRALGMRERSLGANHPDVARSMHNLAVVYQMRGDVARARSFYEGAIALLQKYLPPEEPELQTIVENFRSLGT